MPTPVCFSNVAPIKNGCITITSCDRVFSCQESVIPLHLCVLDPKNPRYGWLLSTSKEPPTSEMLMELLKKDDQTKPLLESVKANGGLAESIYVKEANGVYIVKEGNRRTTVYNMLHESDPQDRRWKSIRAIVVPSEISELEFNVWLSNQHGMGKRDWDSYSKALFYKDMLKAGVSLKDIAIRWGRSEKEVNYQLTTVGTVMEYAKLTGDKEADKNFPQLDIWNRLPEEIKDNDGTKQIAFKAIAEGKFKNCKDVRKLKHIAKSPLALKALADEKNAEDAVSCAMEIIREEDPTSARSILNKKIKQSRDLLKRNLGDVVDCINESDHATIQNLIGLINEGIRAVKLSNNKELVKKIKAEGIE